MEPYIRRDYLAQDRTHLANERTLLSFLRTGLAFCAAGAVLIKLVHGKWTIILALDLIILGIILFIYGIRNYYMWKKKINRR